MINSCSLQNAKPDNKERIHILNTCKPSDEFMAIFLTFIRKNNLSGVIIQYENELFDKKYLAGFDDASLESYFRDRINRKISDPCVSQAIMNKIAPALSLFTYEAYKTEVEQNNRKGSKEYTFLDYMKNYGVNFEEALRFALQDNELSPDKKYFYLLVTMPGKVCEQ